jgi:hypothetical protein
MYNKYVSCIRCLHYYNSVTHRRMSLVYEVLLSDILVDER